MGLCSSCFDEPATYEEKIIPHKSNDQEEIRRRMLAAAEERQKQQDKRGLHNPERVKAKEERLRALEKTQGEAGRYQSGEGGLRWRMD